MEQEMQTEEGGRFGVVFLHTTEDVYEDLVGPTYGSSSDATEAYLRAKGAGGYRGTIVQRQEDGTWLTLYSRQTPKEWQRATIERELAPGQQQTIPICPCAFPASTHSIAYHDTAQVDGQLEGRAG